MGKKVTYKEARGTLNRFQQGLFSRGTEFSANFSGRVMAPYREMMIGEKMTPGRNAASHRTTKFFTDFRRMELPSSYKGEGFTYRNKYEVKGGYRKIVGKTKVTTYSWGVPKNGSSVITLTPKDLYRHLVIVAHQIPIASEHWRMVLARRALAVFQESFKLKRFNTKGGHRWKAISEWTKNKRKGIINQIGTDKRKWKSHWPGAGKLMQETNFLYNSLHIVDNSITSMVVAGARYAGIHNFGKDESGVPYTYGNGFGGIFSPPKVVTQRQFMGHSSKIDEFIAVYEKRYLFDSVFRSLDPVPIK